MWRESVSSSRLANTPRRRGELSRAFGRVAEFVLHRGHRDITRVTLAGADRDVRRCLCIAGAEALHLALYHASGSAVSLARPPRRICLTLSHALLLYYAAILFLSSTLSSAILRANLRVIARQKSHRISHYLISHRQKSKTSKYNSYKSRCYRYEENNVTYVYF